MGRVTALQRLLGLLLVVAVAAAAPQSMGARRRMQMREVSRADYEATPEFQARYGRAAASEAAPAPAAPAEAASAAERDAAHSATRSLLQTALPAFNMTGTCTDDEVTACMQECDDRFRNSHSYLCPCFSSVAECMTKMGCGFQARLDVANLCTRDGWCKGRMEGLYEGDCKYRAGDVGAIDTRRTYRIR